MPARMFRRSSSTNPLATTVFECLPRNRPPFYIQRQELVRSAPADASPRIKRRHRGRVVEVSPRVAHGSYKRVNLELERLAYKKPNLSAIERQNGTARRMNAYLVRKSLAFGRT